MTEEPEGEFYSRLCAEDASFLASEDVRTPMVLGVLVVYDAKPLKHRDGSLDVERIRRHIAGVVPSLACLRQRLAYTPLFDYPVWVDADEVDLDFHISRYALPLPGDTTLLAELAGRLHGRLLPRDRPLWEICVIEGLQHDRFALLIRVHHALVDGGSGLELAAALHAPERGEGGVAAAPRPPQPAPPPIGLFLDELTHRFLGVSELVAGGVRAALHPAEAASRGSALLGGLLETAKRLAAPTPINARVGSRRRVHWFSTPVADLKRIRAELGGTLNDVVLAIAAGALRRFFLSGGDWDDDKILRVACPSNRRRSAEERRAGNYTSTFVVDLPVHLPDRMDRYRAVVEATRRAKESGQSEAIQTVIDLADRTVPELVGSIFALSSRVQNLVISNVQGPETSLELLGCQATEIHPLTVLLARDALALTVFSYSGRMSWVLCSDGDVIPSLASLASELSREFESFRSQCAKTASECAGPGS